MTNDDSSVTKHIFGKLSTHLEWQYSTASTICQNFLLAKASDMRPCLAMYSKNKIKIILILQLCTDSALSSAPQINGMRNQ